MSALTSDRDTQERVPQLRTLEAAADLYAGALVAVNAAGKAVPASDTAGLAVIGRAQQAAKIGDKITAKAGCFAFDAPSGVTFTAADIGKTVYVSDDHTVALTGTENAVTAGVVFDVDTQGVWVVVGRGTASVAAHTHTIEIADVTGLQTALDAKADAAHTHTIGITDVTGLQAALDAKADQA